MIGCAVLFPASASFNLCLTFHHISLQHTSGNRTATEFNMRLSPPTELSSNQLVLTHHFDIPLHTFYQHPCFSRVRRGCGPQCVCMKPLVAAATHHCFGILTVPACDASMRYETFRHSPHRSHKAKEEPCYDVLDAVFVVNVSRHAHVPCLHELQSCRL